MMHHAQIAQRAFNTPLMVDPAKALAFLSGLGPRITGQDITFAGVDTDTVDPPSAAQPARASLLGTDLVQRYQRDGSQPCAIIDDIAVIEIAGTLVHRGAWIGQSSGLTSYEGVAAQLQAALADPAVREKMQRAGEGVVERLGGALERTLAALEPYLLQLRLEMGAANA